MTNFLFQLQNFLTHSSVSPGFLILFCIALFFLIREIATWYWKINRIISLLEEIRDNTNPIAPLIPPDPRIKDGTLVRSSTLKQPFDLRLVTGIFGGLLLIYGIVMMVRDERAMGVVGLAAALIFLLPIAIKDRMKMKRSQVEKADTNKKSATPKGAADAVTH